MPRLSTTERLGLWTERLDRFQSAHVTVAEFCRRESISVATFYRWKEQLNPKSKSKQQRKPINVSDAKFVPVMIEATSPTAKLNLPGGASIELPVELCTGRLAHCGGRSGPATGRADEE